MNSFNWTTADYLQASYVCITILGIMVTAYMAVWVVRSVQSKIDNERALKEHFAHEIIDLRKESRLLLGKLIKGDLKAWEIKRCHYRLSTHMNNLLSVLNSRYGIDKKKLRPYRINLMKIIEEDCIFENSYRLNVTVALENETLNKLYRLEKDNDHLFNDILLQIYEQKN